MTKNFIFVFALAILPGSVIAQREFSRAEGDTVYTMKRYVFMMLDAGNNVSQDSITAAKIQQGHMAHLTKMAKSGQLAIAGPFEKAGEHRGLLIFDVETIDEAIKLESQTRLYWLEG